jgi:sphingosine kinase
MQRSDWKEAIKIPLALIPGGSSNAMAKSISTTTPELATLNLIQGHTRKFDLFGIKYMQSDKLVYGFLELLWTFVADVDIESETMRWAGSNRFIVAAVFRLLRLRRYTGKLSFLPATKPRTESETLMRFKDLKTVPEDWKTVSTVFTYFMAMNAPWAASDFLVAPKARLNDGAIDLVWIEDASRRNLVRVLLDTESGNYVKEPWVKYEKVEAFILEPTPGEHSQILNVDGEKIPYEKILVESIPSLATLIVPRWHKEDQWEV